MLHTICWLRWGKEGINPATVTPLLALIVIETYFAYWQITAIRPPRTVLQGDIGVWACKKEIILAQLYAEKEPIQDPAVVQAHA